VKTEAKKTAACGPLFAFQEEKSMRADASCEISKKSLL
jgi:hypothetical protein